ncbi:hypothetical protein BSU01_08970 [Erwinia billingiae]|uniref:type II toxin-antitoxin system RelE/ParE family toxin n=1 Tax=Erwinia billingiae TaxID=182337 RepID=UPI0019D07254|nr:type II toxin-antitoxin system RelE/ParE family toxin [Erwinia billingiae]MBN7121842.1 hypothetical protein [Erwinia billingiae]
MGEKAIDWRGSSYNDLLAFPEDAKRVAGFELGRVQHGEDPRDFKRINDWGAGVIEIRLEDNVNQYRVVSFEKFAEAVYVLHSFLKKTQKTSPSDVAIIKARYRAVVAERREL